MPRLHAFELVPDEAGREAVLADWQALRDAGLPSQLDHTGGTNTPHVTVLAAPVLPGDDRAVDVLGPVLPARVRATGLLLIGGQKVTVARALDVDDALVAAVLRSARGDRRPGPPGLAAARDPGAAGATCRRWRRPSSVLGYGDVELQLTGLRRWDPVEGAVTGLLPTTS